MTVFDGIVTALLEGLWRLLVVHLFLGPGRLLLRLWRVEPTHRWAGLWTLQGALVFWAGVLAGWLELR